MEGIIVYDCWKTEGKVAAISLKRIADCPNVLEDYMETEKYIQVLQRNSFSKIHVYSCLVEITRNVYRCGMFSHVSLQPSGLLSYVLELSATDCRSLHETKALNLYGTHLIAGLKGNASTVEAVTLAGSINSDGSCEGATFLHYGQTFQEAVVQATVRITLRDFETLIKLDDNDISLPGGVSCSFLKGYCMDSMLGITYWNINQVGECSDADISVLYEGIASFIKVASPDSGIVNEYAVVEQADYVFALQIHEQIGLCLMEVHSTEHPRLVVMEKKAYGFKFTRNQKRLTENTNLLSYMNSKFLYVEVTVKQALNKLHKNAIHRRCLLHREILKNRLLLAPLSPNAVALLLQNEPGYIGTILGECLVIAKCTARVAEIRRTEQCYKQLPVTVDNKSFFISPLTHILQSRAEQVTCNEISTPMYEIGGTWIGFNPLPQYQMQPKILSPNEEISLNFTPVNLGKAGLYSYTEIEGLQEVLLFGLERESIINILVRKLANVTTNDQGLSSTLLFNEKDLKEIAISTMSYIWESVLTFGTLFSAIYGVYFVFRIIKYLFNLGLNALTLYHTFGINWRILAACCSSTALLVVQQENLRPNRDNIDLIDKEKCHKEIEIKDQTEVKNTDKNSTTNGSNSILTAELQVKPDAMYHLLAQGSQAWR